MAAQAARRPVRTGACGDSLGGCMADRSADAREPLVGVSLKMFLGYAESLRYLAGVASAAPGFSGVGVFVLPSFPVIAEAANTLRGTAVAYGAQDGHWEREGAFTGCVSP